MGTQQANAPQAPLSIIDRAEIDRISKEDSQILDAARLVAEALPDVRQDMVELALERLASRYYDSPDVKAHRLQAG